jgi:hypothetical protein
VTSIKDPAFAIDKNVSTRATSGTPNYVGMSYILDLVGEYQISRVAQVHGEWPEDFAGEYKIETSRRKNESEYREVWRGRGEPRRSVANFSPVTTRYIRITALQNRDKTHWWSIAELRTNRDEDVVERGEDENRLEREIRRATAQGLAHIEAALDESSATRATTGRPDYAGSWILLDLGGSYTVARVAQVHNPDDGDFPARYKVEVSENGNRWQTVWEGEGQSARSRAVFAPARARYIRITATEARNNRNSWSVSKINVSG